MGIWSAGSFPIWADSAPLVVFWPTPAQYLLSESERHSVVRPPGKGALRLWQVILADKLDHRSAAFSRYIIPAG